MKKSIILTLTILFFGHSQKVEFYVQENAKIDEGEGIKFGFKYRVKLGTKSTGSFFGSILSKK